MLNCSQSFNLPNNIITTLHFVKVMPTSGWGYTALRYVHSPVVHVVCSCLLFHCWNTHCGAFQLLLGVTPPCLNPGCQEGSHSNDPAEPGQDGCLQFTVLRCPPCSGLDGIKQVLTDQHTQLPACLRILISKFSKLSASYLENALSFVYILYWKVINEADTYPMLLGGWI